jgi:hypothetical protein
MQKMRAKSLADTFMMDEGIDRVKATYGDNYHRLVAIKRSPQGVGARAASWDGPVINSLLAVTTRPFGCSMCRPIG